MAVPDPRSDAELLGATATDADAFAIFYRRHLPAVVAYFRARLRDRELAADLSAETFAAALLASRRYRPDVAPAGAWLYAIARHKLLDSLRRGRVEDNARKKLGMAPVELHDDDLARVDELAATAGGDGKAVEALETLPHDVRAALGARVIDERGYAEIARDLRCSEQVVRKRVSRGLAQLRTRLAEERK
jgi:RNA polymerase sigma-70 factor (ECF subfamily)